MQGPQAGVSTKAWPPSIQGWSQKRPFGMATDQESVGKTVIAALMFVAGVLIGGVACLYGVLCEIRDELRDLHVTVHF